MSQQLHELSDAIAAVVEATGKSLIRVDGRRRYGTTAIAWREDGHLIAAAHAVQREGALGVTLPDGRDLEARVVGHDPSTDLVVLKVDAALAVPRWRDTSGLKVGHLVVAASRPGRSVRARLGIVSVLGDGLDTAWGGRIEPYLESDLGPHPGFSGSLLLDVDGNALGLNTSGLMRGTSVTLPHATLKRIAEPLIAHGKLRRGYLGVGLHPVKLPENVKAEAGGEMGLVVLAVEPGGPADRAGLTMGDTVVQVSGAPVSDLSELWSRLGEEQIGRDVAVRALRGGKAQAFTVTVGERP
jgi:S1-C subfamily serine protease